MRRTGRDVLVCDCEALAAEAQRIARAVDRGARRPATDAASTATALFQLPLGEGRFEPLEIPLAQFHAGGPLRVASLSLELECALQGEPRRAEPLAFALGEPWPADAAVVHAVRIEVRRDRGHEAQIWVDGVLRRTIPGPAVPAQPGEVPPGSRA